MSNMNFNFDTMPDKDIQMSLGGMMPQLFGAADLHSIYTYISKEQCVEAQPTNQCINSNYFFTQSVCRPVDILIDNINTHMV